MTHVNEALAQLRRWHHRVQGPKARERRRRLLCLLLLLLQLRMLQLRRRRRPHRRLLLRLSLLSPADWCCQRWPVALVKRRSSGARNNADAADHRNYRGSSHLRKTGRQRQPGQLAPGVVQQPRSGGRQAPLRQAPPRCRLRAAPGGRRQPRQRADDAAQAVGAAAGAAHGAAAGPAEEGAGAAQRRVQRADERRRGPLRGLQRPVPCTRTPAQQ